MSSLTDHLLALDPTALTHATTHPFLTAAANSTLPLSLLQTWLAQDRLYASSYLPFIGTLLSTNFVPTGSNRRSDLRWRLSSTLIDALTNIRRELALFEDTAEQEGWLDVITTAEATVPSRITRAYTDLFAGATAAGRGTVVGLVVLWATEECYLRAWRFARGEMGKGEGKGEGKGDVMRKVFIPNWSSDEFEEFVVTLRGLVDELVKEEGVRGGSWLWMECEAAWRQVLWLEAEFWPKVS